MQDGGLAYPGGGDPPGAGQAQGPWGRMALVFTRPSQAFRGLEHANWSWLVPAVIICLLMSLAPQLLYDLHYARQQAALDGMIERGVLNEAQAQEARQRVADDAADRSAGRITQQVLLGLVSGLAFRFVLPAAFLLMGLRFVLEKGVRFPSVLAALSYAAVPAGVREIIRTPLQYAKGSLDVHFGPAVLVGDSRSLGAYALGMLDLFDFWILGLLIVGLAEVGHIPRRRAATLVLPLWLVLVLLRLGLKATPIGSAF